MYTIYLTNKAEKQLKKFDTHIQERILNALERIKIQPERHVQRLSGEQSYRLRVGDYRIIMDIIKNELIILVIKVGHRKNIYKD